MQKIQCEILGLSSSPSTGGAYAILLREIDGNKRLPIIIGAFEAQAIALEIEGIKPPRPLTHDLLKQLTDSLGATVIEIIIDELRDNTFYAKIILEVSGFSQEIDARPSDAIALAVRAQAPIYVSASVMESAAFVPSEEAEEASTTNTITDTGESKKPPSKETKLASLQNKLREAIEGEEYERAAKIRDQIKNLTSEN
ncbi:MAG: bifunctional nuclease family protein [Ignavibacteriaceae bacterium]|nr:bifunctional nuclease family protein [Chlorobium sp.]MCW8822732.1 bifunctional nuclease family protein [Ignavibacteriaceae bacterium]MCW8961783.1 bifunctional nuclease family protein [Ignavibacteriaceae bacterium]MCW9094966.1 bifunctional nuclease family protein [Ignavibacteriaceae bacterium]MCW9097837.1 bifunctional nuclease family protein [Ignavibacteriaceae bacterium]